MAMRKLNRYISGTVNASILMVLLVIVAVVLSLLLVLFLLLLVGVGGAGSLVVRNASLTGQ